MLGGSHPGGAAVNDMTGIRTFVDSFSDKVINPFDNSTVKTPRQVLTPAGWGGQASVYANAFGVQIVFDLVYNPDGNGAAGAMLKIADPGVPVGVNHLIGTIADASIRPKIYIPIVCSDQTGQVFIVEVLTTGEVQFRHDRGYLTQRRAWATDTTTWFDTRLPAPARTLTVCSVQGSGMWPRKDA
jgi:hypothetical protein